ncbi:MAG: radical SAM/SPASM domain-containing protein [Methermicoccaceae archaeon]
MPKLYSSVLLDVDIEVEDGITDVRATGVLSRLGFVRRMLGLLDGQRAVRYDGKRVYLSTWLPPIPSGAFTRLVKSQMRAMAGRYTPDQLTVSITESCPNRCRHCALPDSHRGLSLSYEQIAHIVREALEMGTTSLVIDGGEPLTYAGVEHIPALVDERAITTMFTSASTATREKLASLKRAGLYSLHVSLDSPVEEEHDAMRGREGVFEQAERCVRWAREVGLLCDIYVVLSRDNVHHLQGFYELAKQWGAHELSFYEIVPTGRYMDTDRSLTPQDRKTLDEFMARYERELSTERDGVRVFSIIGSMRELGCAAGRRWAHITPSGDVLPCACIPLPYGNVLREPLRAIWRRIRADGAYRGAGECLMRNPSFRARLEGGG